MNVHLALSQFRPAKADPAASLDGIEAVFRRVTELDPRPRVLLFPESALTGYFLEGGVREHAWSAPRLFAALRERYEAAGGADRPLEVGFGFYERHRERVYNTALYAELGGADPGILHLHRKVFLPTYGVFQEERFVEAGDDVRSFETAWGRAATLVCEDAFHSISGMLAALDGAEAIFVLSAAPARGTRPDEGRPESVERWDRVARGMAEEHGVFVAACQLVGFEGGKGFPGGSAVYGPRGDTLGRAGLWEPELLTASLDLDQLLPARVESPLLADLETTLPRILRGSGSRAGGVGARPAGSPAPGERRSAPGAAAEPPDPPPAAGPGPDDLSPLEIDPGLVEAWLVHFLREEVREKRGFERVVLGLSGGVDSSVSAALCARAFGPEAVRGFYLPSEASSPESRRHAEDFADTLGIDLRTIDITSAVEGYLEHEEDPGAHRRGNVTARQRMIVLFDQSAKLDALPVGTGNKSERLLGYFTWHADDSPPINPLGDLFKTQVWQLAEHLGVPPSILEKPATADLIRGQTDEEDLGISYRRADLILYHVLRGYTPERLVRYGFDAGEVENVHRRLESTHFKRRPSTVAMLSDTTIGEWYLRPVDY